MKVVIGLLASFGLLASIVLPLFAASTVQAAALASETFTGVATTANAWTSGGSGGSVACLTAASTSAANSVPMCSGGPLDSDGSGFLRLTPTANSRSGFVIYNTPVAASDGLNIEFDMYQYGGSGADGVSFFLIDGAANPTQPGAPGGSLGYSRNDSGTAGIVGGYVGVGFDRFGNFSNPAFGSGGPGAQANSITVRGSEASDYQYVTHTAANSSLSGTTRTNSLRKVKINISTGNIMSVAVDYNGGNGYETELSGIDLSTINGPGSLPANFKFGFAASTGGSTNTHEISGLTVETNPPSVSMTVSHSGNFVQGATGQFTLGASNGSSAEATDGLITVTQTLPTGLTPTAASGSGWTCNINGQIVTCTRPGDSGNALQPGTSAPNITVTVAVANNASSSLDTTASVNTPNNDSLTSEDTDTVTVLAGSYLDDDGIYNVVEDAAPNSGDGNNDGTDDSQQDNVTSLSNPVTSSYAVLETTGCSGTNSSVSVAAESANAAADGSYTYPVGLMDFKIDCTTPGDTATVIQYFYGSYNAATMVARKYDTVRGTYQDIPGASITSVTLAGQPALKVQYQITDGGPLDEDSLADGTITDPAGPAVLTSTVATPSTPGAPDTGLPQQAMTLYYAAGLAGVSLIVYGATIIRRSRPAESTASSQ